MGEEPGEIRQEIEETRSRMGETVDAIGYKTDVKQRASDYVSEKASAVTERVSGTVPDKESVQATGRQAVSRAQQNPLGLVIGSAALGFVVGLLAPATRVEDERVGGVADDLKERARETGQEALARGKDVAREAASSAAETAKERGRVEGDELSSTLRESAQSARYGESPDTERM
jgi:ElaB/YqjD/DUF883 family membrane-anchored ribosome-binding protein